MKNESTTQGLGEILAHMGEVWAQTKNGISNLK